MIDRESQYAYVHGARLELPATLAAFALLAATTLFATQAKAAPAPKVEICHIPPGNPANFHTIKVSEKALAAHFDHGDIAGACNAVCATLCDDGNECTIDDTDDCEEQGCPPSPRPPIDCVDGNECTDDRCDSATGCVNETIENAPCEGVPACTENGRCSANGVCLGTPIENCCEFPSNESCEPTFCSPSECVQGEDYDMCVPGVFPCPEGPTCAAPRCNDEQETCSFELMDDLCPDDGIDCTDDICDPENGHLESGCTYLPVNANCEILDACQPLIGCDPNSGCVYGEVPDCCTSTDDCTQNSNQCTFTECDLDTNKCVENEILQCDSGFLCNEGTGVCDPAPCFSTLQHLGPPPDPSDPDPVQTCIDDCDQRSGCPEGFCANKDDPGFRPLVEQCVVAGDPTACEQIDGLARDANVCTNLCDPPATCVTAYSEGPQTDLDLKVRCEEAGGCPDLTPCCGTDADCPQEQGLLVFNCSILDDETACEKLDEFWASQGCDVCDPPPIPEEEALACRFIPDNSFYAQYFDDFYGPDTPYLFQDTEVPWGGFVDINCESGSTTKSCTAQFRETVGPLDLPGIAEVCLKPTTCPVGTISCEAGLDQRVSVTQYHKLDTFLCEGENPNPGCQSACEAFCASQGQERVANSPKCEGYCREGNTPMCWSPGDLNPAPPGYMRCGPEDTCDEENPDSRHDGACGCQCVDVGAGTPADPGEGILYIGWKVELFFDNNLDGEADRGQGPDGDLCTADDEPPDETLQSNCFPFTTSVATAYLPDAAYYEQNNLGFYPLDGEIGPVSTEPGARFPCAYGALTTASGAILRGAQTNKDTRQSDFAILHTIVCE